MLELSGQAAILGADCPAVSFAEHGLFGARVDHRLDREADTRLHARAAGFRRGIVRHRWWLVKLAADAVADVFLHDAEVVLSGPLDDRLADIRHSSPWTTDVDAGP